MGETEGPGPDNIEEDLRAKIDAALEELSPLIDQAKASPDDQALQDTIRERSKAITEMWHGLPSTQAVETEAVLSHAENTVLSGEGAEAYLRRMAKEQLTDGWTQPFSPETEPPAEALEMIEIFKNFQKQLEPYFHLVETKPETQLAEDVNALLDDAEMQFRYFRMVQTKYRDQAIDLKGFLHRAESAKFLLEVFLHDLHELWEPRQPEEGGA